MPYTLGPTWSIMSDHEIFGRRVRLHQNESAVILEVEGVCLVGDVTLMPDGKAGMVFPRHLAVCPDVEQAKRAVELAYAAHTGGARD